jgi:hypothetical protein
MAGGGFCPFCGFGPKNIVEDCARCGGPYVSKLVVSLLKPRALPTPQHLMRRDLRTPAAVTAPTSTAAQGITHGSVTGGLEPWPAPTGTGAFIPDSVGRKKQGWQCPNCLAIWGPRVPGCLKCNGDTEELT